MKVGFAVCGSFCTFSQVFPIMELLSRDYDITPIFSEASYSTDTRFGNARDNIQLAQEISGVPPIHTIVQAEPIGPKKMFDILVVAPCTGNTLAKLAHGIADGPVSMAVKSHLRNGRPILIAVSTNDALNTAAENIGKLMAKKHFFFVPFCQDDPYNKPCSMVADFSRIPKALEAALEGKQLQPVIL